jgi:hypothetical protein
VLAKIGVVELAETGAMPTQNGLGLDEDDRLPPRRQRWLRLRGRWEQAQVNECAIVNLKSHEPSRSSAHHQPILRGLDTLPDR